MYHIILYMSIPKNKEIRKKLSGFLYRPSLEKLLSTDKYEVKGVIPTEGAAVVEESLVTSEGRCQTVKQTSSYLVNRNTFQDSFFNTAVRIPFSARVSSFLRGRIRSG